MKKFKDNFKSIYLLSTVLLCLITSIIVSISNICGYDIANQSIKDVNLYILAIIFIGILGMVIDEQLKYKQGLLICLGTPIYCLCYLFILASWSSSIFLYIIMILLFIGILIGSYFIYKKNMEKITKSKNLYMLFNTLYLMILFTIVILIQIFC